MTMTSGSYSRRVILQPRESRLGHYLPVIRRQAWIVLLIPAVICAATFAVPDSRKSGSTLIFTCLAGLMLGLLLASGREAFDSRIRGRRDAEASFGAPVLGALPKELHRRAPPSLPVEKPEDGAAALELLRERVQLDRRDNEATGSSVFVTSAGPSTGKVAVAANLAAALARAGERVVCVDVDVGRPALHVYLGTRADAPGLLEVLDERVELDDALIRVELTPPSTNGAASERRRGRLEVLQSGNPRSRLEVLTLENVDRLLAQLREQADYVVLDGPTLLAPDFFPLAVKSDNVLVVARRGRTTKAQADSARKTLEGLGVDNVGVVLTDARSADACV